MADTEKKEVTIYVTPKNSLSKIMEVLKEMDLLDLSYPPASLESFFLNKYRSD